MKIIFFGTPYYVLPICDALHKQYNHGHEKQFIAVVTQPPKKSGRDKSFTRSEVDHWAFKHNLQIHFDYANLPEADLGICASYGKIIPESVLKKFSHGVLNIHPSLLPEYRGASPVQAAIAAGEQTTGVTIFKMDAKMDHGDIISSFIEDILKNDTTQTLRDRIFERSAEFLIEMLPNYLNGKIKPKPQDEDKATYTKIITKQDGFIAPKLLGKILSGVSSDSEFKISFIPDQEIPLNATSLHNFIRALQTWPEAWTKIDIGNQNIKRLKLLKSHIEDNKLVLDEVQLEGKNPVSWEQFAQGYPDYSF